jgi:hypothetical protein
MSALSVEFVSLLHEVASENNYSVEKYSGRAMYDRQCIAFKCNHGSPTEFFSLVIDRVLSNTKTFNSSTFHELRNMMDEVQDLMSDICTDQLGKGYVFYSPQTSWEKRYEGGYVEPEEDDDDDEEDEE